MMERTNGADTKEKGRAGTSGHSLPLGNCSIQDFTASSPSSLCKGCLDLQRLSNTIGNRGFQKPLSESGVVQRLRVHLGTDENLLGMMDEVPLPGENGASIAMKIGDNVSRQVENDENIVFEGHGRSMFTRWAIEQEDFSPKLLAFVAFHLVLDPNHWTGKILLFGCSTGKLAVQVSREAFKLFKRPITVIGTLGDVSFLKRVPGGHVQDTAYVMNKDIYSEDDWRQRVEYMKSVQMLTRKQNGLIRTLLDIEFNLKKFLYEVCSDTGKLVQEGKLNTAIARVNEPIRAIHAAKRQVAQIVSQIAFDQPRFNPYSPSGENIRIGEELRRICGYIENLPILPKVDETAKEWNINERIQEWETMRRDVGANCLEELDQLHCSFDGFVLEARRAASVVVDLFDRRFVRETRQKKSGLFKFWEEETT